MSILATFRIFSKINLPQYTHVHCQVIWGIGKTPKTGDQVTFLVKFSLIIS